MSTTKYLILFLSLVLISINGQNKLHSLFTDNMVLQANTDNRIWGWTTPGAEVEVLFLSDSYFTKSDSSGYWETFVKCSDYGGPYNLEIFSDDTLRLKNVLLGDVYICSGQSNMGMPLAGWGRVNNYENEIAEADFPDIRVCTVPLTKSPVPKEDVEIDGWYECSPNSIKEFSAAAYFFGREIYKETNIPIGLIHVSKGGTPIESWMSEESLSNYQEFNSEIEFVKSNSPNDYDRIERQYKKDYSQWLDFIYSNDPGYSDSIKWYSEDYDYSDWSIINIPSVWENEGLPDYDGTVWFKKEINIPKKWTSDKLTISLGAVQDYDITYFNGCKIGEQLKRNNPSVYNLSKGISLPGKNIITIRVLDNYGVGGLWDEEPNIYLTNGVERISLAGGWFYKPGLKIDSEDYKPPVRPLIDRKPIILYNGMIAPIVKFNVKGIIWYQGESNASRAYQYRSLFKEMIKEWRNLWNNEKLPFYFVQLANYKQKSQQPQESSWAELREAQSMALELPNTGMATAVDIGNAEDVHPKNKQEVGRRLALIALNQLYDKDIVSSGPVMKEFEIVGDRFQISFINIANGLVLKGSQELKGFAIAGKDKKYYWAKAQIIDNKVIVYSEKVKNPIAVRYSWADNPSGNLYNSENLPAFPFRTDDWRGVTVNHN